MAFLTVIAYIAAALLILLFMITIHELGHYIAGKLLGFKITEFSIGFGKAIYKRVNPKTGEVFAIRMLPLGGYCAFAGDDAAAGEEGARKDAEERENTKTETEESDTEKGKKSKTKSKAEVSSEPEKKVCLGTSNYIGKNGRTVYSNNGDFNDQAPWKRLIVLVAGALANFISAIFFAILLLMIVGYTQVLVVDSFNPKDPSIPADTIQTGDEIIAFNGETFSLLNNYIRVRDKHYIYTEKDGKPAGTVDITLRRNGEEKIITLTIYKVTVVGEDGLTDESFGTGINGSFHYEKMSLGQALLNCVGFCLELSWMLLVLLFGMIFKGENLNAVTGIVGTTAVLASQLHIDPIWIFILFPFISVNLAVMNLLPIPALDGGRVVFVAIEWVRGKPINPNIEARIHAIGFFVLIGLMVVADIAFLIRGGLAGLGLFQIFCSFLL